ncbi:MAG: SDR family oxidoreductase [Alphaproteobacteria bacterium]
MKRFADPFEVAALAVLLASDEAGYMTGEDLALDGRPRGGIGRNTVNGRSLYDDGSMIGSLHDREA